MTIIGWLQIAFIFALVLICVAPLGGFMARVFWFTCEFGVIVEDGELRCYGAGLLSSYGEIEEFRDMEIRPLDIKAMATVDYDITSYQPVLFGAASFDELEDVVGGFFTTVDDDTPARLGLTANV